MYIRDTDKSKRTKFSCVSMGFERGEFGLISVSLVICADSGFPAARPCGTLPFLCFARRGCSSFSAGRLHRLIWAVPVCSCSCRQDSQGCLYSYVLMDLLMSFATSLSIAGAVLIVWLRRNRYRKYYKPLFITGLALSCILNWQDWWDLSLYFLLAAAILLWLPLDKSVCCRECGFRNVKTSHFCGGCGGKLK